MKKYRNISWNQAHSFSVAEAVSSAKFTTILEKKARSEMFAPSVLEASCILTTIGSVCCPFACSVAHSVLKKKLIYNRI